jgi:hypothetical protein
LILNKLDIISAVYFFEPAKIDISGELNNTGKQKSEKRLIPDGGYKIQDSRCKIAGTR